MLRLLKEMPKVDVQIADDSLPVLRVGISLYEPLDQHWATPPPECPVCGNSDFNAGERLSALLMPRLDYGENGLEYVMLVWVHPRCYESCTETNEPDPVPW